MACWYLCFLGGAVLWLCLFSFFSAETWGSLYIFVCQMYFQGVSSLPDYVSFKIFPGTPLEHIFSAAGDDLLELLQGFFTFNPSTRTTATQVIYTVAARTPTLVD